MKVSLSGKLVDCVNNKSKDGKKDYYSLVVYDSGNTYRVGVNKDIHDHYLNFVNDDVVLEDISLWCEGRYSLYIRTA